MVGRGHGHDVTWKLVDLHEKKRYHALDFTGFVIVATLLPDGVELVEQKHAWHGPHVFEQACEARVRLAEVRPHKCVVADREKLHCQSFGNSLGNRSFTVTRRPRQQYSMTRLHAVGSKQVGSVLFLDQLPQLLADGERENQIVEALGRHSLKDRILACLTCWTCRNWRRHRDSVQSPFEAVGIYVVTLTTLFSHGGLDRRAQSRPVTGYTGAHNRK
ncbi:MAG: hypothetical protein JWR80_2975 [Bradyrhizobium sp.]|nr:hypothetical protein [Bradyrhizobium sp.]